MGQAEAPIKQHTITWDQFRAFAAEAGRDLTHAYRVFKGERTSDALRADFTNYFGFPMEEAVLAGRQKKTDRGGPSMSTGGAGGGRD